MFEGQEIEVINLFWALIVVPLFYGYRLRKNANRLKKEKADRIEMAALNSLNKEQIRQLIKQVIREEIQPIVKKQDDLEKDFKTINGNFMQFVETFYAKINDITFKIMGKSSD